jgi:hypothetical protein
VGHALILIGANLQRGVGELNADRTGQSALAISDSGRILRSLLPASLMAAIADLLVFRYEQ